MPSHLWGTCLFIHVQTTDRVMPLGGYFVHGGPWWFSQEHRGPDPSSGDSPLCLVLMPHPEEQGCISRSSSISGPSWPSAWPRGQHAHPWVPHQPHSNPLSPKPRSQQTFSPTAELVLAPRPPQHPFPLTPSGRGWCPPRDLSGTARVGRAILPAWCWQTGQIPHEGRVMDAVTAISGESTVNLQS